MASRPISVASEAESALASNPLVVLVVNMEAFRALDSASKVVTTPISANKTSVVKDLAAAATKSTYLAMASKTSADAAATKSTRLAMASKTSADAVLATISDKEALAEKALKSTVLIMASNMVAMTATASAALDSMTQKLVATERRATVMTTLTISSLASADPVVITAVDTVEATVDMVSPAVLAPVPTSVQIMVSLATGQSISLERASNTSRKTSTS